VLENFLRSTYNLFRTDLLLMPVYFYAHTNPFMATYLLFKETANRLGKRLLALPRESLKLLFYGKGDRINSKVLLFTPRTVFEVALKNIFNSFYPLFVTRHFPIKGFDELDFLSEVKKLDKELIEKIESEEDRIVFRKEFKLESFVEPSKALASLPNEFFLRALNEKPFYVNKKIPHLIYEAYKILAKKNVFYSKPLPPASDLWLGRGDEKYYCEFRSLFIRKELFT